VGERQLRKLFGKTERGSKVNRRVFLWAADKAGCGYYRCRVPAEALRLAGHEAVTSTVWRDEYGTNYRGWHSPDVLVAQRTFRDAPSELFRRRSDVFRIFELDDDLFAVPSHNPAAETYNRPDVQANLKRNIRVADRVIVSTPPLADKVSKLNPAVVVVPNYIPERAVVAPLDMPAFSFGWSGSPTHAHDWASTTGNYVYRFLRDNPGVKFKVIGSTPFRVPSDVKNRVLLHDWVSSVEKHWEALTFDVGLAPLARTEFNRSKSHIKALEYNARGIPVLASAAGEYPSFVENGFNGALVHNAHQWRKMLRDLHNDRALFEFMQQNAFDKAREWTVERNYRDIVGAYLP
jgi:hypothetical protein